MPEWKRSLSIYDLFLTTIVSFLWVNNKGKSIGNRLYCSKF